MANRPQSRYQIGLPYDPAMAAGGYRPERVSMGEIGPGDYGVTPIPLPNTDGGGVVAPLATEGGSGLGGAGLGALSLLANPNLLTRVTDLFNTVTKPGGGFGVNAQELAHPMPDLMPGVGLDMTAHELAHPMLDALGGGGGDLLKEGVSSGLGGGFDFASLGAGMAGGALGNYLVNNYSNYEGQRDPTGKSVGAGIGSVLGGVLGSILGPVGSAFGAFLGSEFGGMVGGQFGPDMSTGPIYASDIAYRNGQWQTNAHADNGAQVNPALGEGFLQGLQSYMAANGYEMAPGVDYRFVIGNTRGGEDTDAYGSGFYINPNPISGAGEGPASQMYFGTDLAANWQTPYEAMTAAAPGAGSQYWDPNIGLDQFAQSINPDSLTGDAMLQYVFNYMNNYGLVQPIGGAPRPQPMGNTGNPTEQAMG